ncbi:hypothetical protein [Massilia rubra]|uniref:Secretion system X translation initiation factor n=1 Tax=Massilia rubra TaxID=2607910 RepID=A0ABX0LBV8_9BURK|nr:hypothetical protein [Massilia rubra]NHZ32153.1 hypothetical protein [Massilia rubra]
MSPGRRRVALYGVLLLCLAAARLLVPDPARETSLTAPSSRSGEERARQRPLDHRSTNVNELQAMAWPDRSRGALARDDKNPFDVKTWAVGPSAASTRDASPPPALAPQPTAPALPFLFAGKLELAPGKWLVYLTKGEQSIAVEMGETFEGIYRFEGIENDHIVIVYLPLQTKQLLPMGSAS